MDFEAFCKQNASKVMKRSQNERKNQPKTRKSKHNQAKACTTLSKPPYMLVWASANPKWMAYTDPTICSPKSGTYTQPRYAPLSRAHIFNSFIYSYGRAQTLNVWHIFTPPYTPLSRAHIDGIYNGFSMETSNANVALFLIYEQPQTVHL